MAECTLMVGYAFRNADTYQQLPSNAPDSGKGVCHDKACVREKLDTTIADLRAGLGAPFDTGGLGGYPGILAKLEDKMIGDFGVEHTAKTIYYYDEQGQLICVTTHNLLLKSEPLSAVVESVVGDIHADYTIGWVLRH